jgi:hypothetical protein
VGAGGWICSTTIARQGHGFFQSIASCFAVAGSFDQTCFEQRIQEIDGSLLGKIRGIPSLCR